MTQNLEKPVTKQYLAEFTKKILLPEIDTIFDGKLKQTKDEILISNDKLSKKLDKILKEQAAHTRSYQRLEKRINYLEAVVRVLAEQSGLETDFTKTLE